MTLISQSIRRPINGVSEMPQQLRSVTQADEQINALATVGEGLMKRPPSKHLAQLSGTAPALSQVHTVDLGPGQKYLAVFTGDDVLVFDALTGAAVTVYTIGDKSYIGGVKINTFNLTQGFAITDGTTLSAYIPPDGGSWSLLYGSEGSSQHLTITSDAITIPSSYSGLDATAYAYLKDAGSGDYSVSMDIAYPSTTTAEICYLTGRINPSDGSGYAALLKTDGTLSIAKIAYASKSTQLGSVAITAPGTSAFTLKMTFAGSVITVYVNGVQKLQVTDSTYTYAGGNIYSGLATHSNPVGGTIDNFTFDYTTTSSSSIASGLRMVTVGATTFVANKGVSILQGSEVAPENAPEALVFIRQADYSTTYSVTLNGSPVAVTTADGSTPQAREAIATDVIATNLLTAITSSALLSDFSVTRYGSTLYITRPDGADFTLSTKDGLGDNGMLAIKGTTQRFTDLPANAKDGFVVEITGDPGTDADNYWVVYDDLGLPQQAGVWRETVAPSTPISLDASTMPHQLVYRGSLDDIATSAGTPALPTVSLDEGSTVTEDLYDTYAHASAESGPFNADVSLKFNSDSDTKWSKLTHGNGIETTYTVGFDVATTQLLGGDTIIFTVYSTPDGTTLTQRAQVRYGTGQYLQDQMVSFTATLAANTFLKYELTYPGGSTPPTSPDLTGSIYLHGANNALPGLSYPLISGKRVIFDPDTLYPVGATINAIVGGTLTLGVITDGVTASYAITSADKTGSAVATGLCAAIAAKTHFSGTTEDGNGTISVLRDSGTSYVQVSWTWDDTKQMHDPNVSYGSITGYYAVNITDGSAGLISAATSTTLTAILDGGVTNRFRAGDVVYIRHDISDTAYFVFGEATWRQREVGDLTSNPFPSFVGQTLNDVFYYQDRLGFLTGNRVILSQAASFFNFFRQSATQLRDDDLIDVGSTASGNSPFHSALLWNNGCFLLTGSAQIALEGDPFLSPKTVSLPVVSNYENDPTIKPIVLGRSIYFPVQRDGSLKMMEYRLIAAGFSSIVDAISISDEVPTYVRGTPIALTGSGSLGTISLLTSDDPTSLYLYSFHDGNTQREQAGWGKWSFDAGCTILSIAQVDKVLSLVVARSDGLYLETIDLTSRKRKDSDTLVYLDRQFDTSTWSGSIAWSGSGIFTITFPYAMPSTATVRLQSPTDPTIFWTATRVTGTSYTVAATQFSGVDSGHWIIGVLYPFTYRLSSLFLRNQQGDVENTGRLDLRWVSFLYDKTGSFTVTISREGRSDTSVSFFSDTLASDRLRVAALARTEDCTITLSDTSPFALRCTGVDWEANYTTRHRRV